MASDLDSVGKYRIDGVLGKGAMGVVYKGYDPFIDRPVAIKTIHKSLLGSEMGQELMQRFSNEAKAVGRLTHPNIVGIFDFDIEDGMPYFVMELVDGRELKSYLKDNHAFEPREAVNIIGQVLDGLAYTHGLGIVHRDIKPANIFVLKNGGVKIADFGIARVDNSELTQIGSVLGTPSYMSPEQCLGDTVDARSDLFSTAVMLYELLTGNKTFKGDMSNTIMHNVVNTNPVEPSKSNPDIPKIFDKVLRKALAKQADQRYQTAEEFKSALEACLDSNAKAGFGNRGLVIGVAVLLGVFIGGGYWVVRDELRAPIQDGQLQTDTVNERPQDKDAPYIKVPEKKEIVDPEDLRKISRLLKAAKAHMMIGRLVSPAGGNAYDAYQTVLEIDPYNQEAKEGIDKVADKFYERCNAMFGQGIIGETRNFVDVGLKLFPEHVGLLALDQQLKTRAALP